MQLSKTRLFYHCDVAIIGGGASGMAAALFAYERCRKNGFPPCTIRIFERNDRLGKKLLTTGNGRCNVTNLDCTRKRFHGTSPEFIDPALAAFPPSTTISFFEKLGVPCVIEDDQKVFPATLHAASVLDSLRLALDEAAINQIMGTRVTTIEKKSDRFHLYTNNLDEHWTASAVIVATGGKCAPASGSDGNGFRLLTPFSHEIIQPLPSIVQLTTDTKFVKPLSGNKIHGTATLLVNQTIVRTESGEILFTDYGLSGPPILQLSGYVSRALHTAQCGNRSCSIIISLDFLPASTVPEVTEMLIKRKQLFGSRTLEEYLTGLFHRRLAYGLLKHALQKPLSTPVSNLADTDIVQIAHTCKSLPVAVSGTMSFAHAQTTIGGIATAGFDPGTMASRNCPGLFACGEILDIDGDCGGFNLQWAWASGFLAGCSAVAFLNGEGT